MMVRWQFSIIFSWLYFFKLLLGEGENFFFHVICDLQSHFLVIQSCLKLGLINEAPLILETLEELDVWP